MVEQWTVVADEGCYIGECCVRVDSKIEESSAHVALKDASDTIGTKPRVMPLILCTFLVVLIGYCWGR